ncbi:hypothetical protein VTK26DRAFT_4544 [Humicola hyalothermophila]
MLARKRTHHSHTHTYTHTHTHTHTFTHTRTQSPPKFFSGWVSWKGVLGLYPFGVALSYTIGRIAHFRLQLGFRFICGAWRPVHEKRRGWNPDFFFLVGTCHASWTWNLLRTFYSARLREYPRDGCCRPFCLLSTGFNIFRRILFPRLLFLHSCHRHH